MTKPLSVEELADAEYARGVTHGLRAWHEEWTPEEVRRQEERVARIRDEVRLARRQRLASLHTQEP